MRVVFILSVISLCFQSQAQTSCGFDRLQQQWQSDPAFRQKEKQLNQQLYEKAQRFSNQRDLQTVLTIPVVVHIIHQNGVENLTDPQVQAGIDQLNLRFQNAAPYFDATGTDVGIQFCLASVDPYGNPTTGITRNVSSLTDLSLPGNTDLAMKNLNRWDPHLYLNIWIMKNTGDPNVAGYATYPSVLSSGAAYDGIGIQYNYYNAYQLAHEAGHYLGLYHTFNNGCLNFNCLLDGDQVCDTPPDATSTFNCPMNSCSTEMNDTSGFNPFVTDVNEAPNYMDYTNCPLSFTAGQAARMNNGLTVGRPDLLLSNGCGQHPGGALPTASFSFGPACGGTQLTSTGANTVGAQWDFNSDGMIDDCGFGFTWNAPATGTYTVTMYAQGFGGVDTVTQVVFAQHYPYQNYPMVNGYGGLSLSSYTGGFVACQGATVSFHGEPGFAHYLWSTGDTTQNLSFVQGTSPQTISLVATDSTGLTWSTCYPVHFDAAPAPIPPVIAIDPADTTNCMGDQLHMSFTYSPIWQSSNLFYYGGNTPFHSSTYAPVINSYNLYYVNQTDSNGCIASSNTVTVNGIQGPYPQTIMQAGGYLMYGPGLHFQWYLDGIPIPNSDDDMLWPTQTGCYKVFSWWSGGEKCGTWSLDSVCLAFVGVKENKLEDGIKIAPNPLSDHATIFFGKEQKNTQVKIKDALGREVQCIDFSGRDLSLDMTGTPPGIYFIEIISSGARITKKIIVR
jgi:hypothetical protein